MLKRFLKFLKGDDPSVVERFEGSYLDHLLEQVHPVVSEQLEDCPEHDPLLLVVAGILRHTMMNVWDPRTTAPLLDSQSPGVPLGFRAPAAETSEFETYEEADETIQFETDGRRDTQELDAVQVEPSEVEDDEEQEADDEEGDDSEGTDDSSEKTDLADDETLDGPPPSSRKSRITEEIDVAEIKASGEEFHHDTTMELDREEMVRRAEDRDSGMRRPRVDTEDVLQAGRLYLAVLIENDRLPTELQLSVAETMLARDMLLGYFIGSEEVADNAHRILALVEQKFREGLFGQARILLELFHTDENSWVQEEHKIFYEDMILKLGIRRRNRLSESEVSAFYGHLERATEDEGLGDLLSWLGRQCLISFHLYMRDPDQIAQWRETIGLCEREGAEENFDLYIPPRRWRAVDANESMTPMEQMRAHISPETARGYVLNHLKTCFVVLRAHGDTGLEDYLDAFFDWTETALDFNSTTIMPEIYRRSMMDAESMEEILTTTFDVYFRERMEERLDEITDDDVDAAFLEAVAGMTDIDIADVAPGYYDLGGFVFDQLLGFAAPESQFPFKIHRLS